MIDQWFRLSKMNIVKFSAKIFCHLKICKINFAIIYLIFFTSFNLCSIQQFCGRSFKILKIIYIMSKSKNKYLYILVKFSRTSSEILVNSIR